METLDVQTYASYLALVGSNLLFILPAVRAYQLRQYMRAFLYGMNLLSSSFYHLCKPVDGICVLPFSILFFMDFLFSITSLMGNILFLAPLRTVTDAWLIGLNMLTIGITLGLLRGRDPPVAVTGVQAAVNLLIVLAVWFLVWRRYHVPPSFDWRDFWIALVSSAIGIGLFVGMHALHHYWIFHSVWHVLAAFASFYLLESRTRARSGLSALLAVSWKPDTPVVPPLLPYPYGVVAVNGSHRH